MRWSIDRHLEVAQQEEVAPSVDELCGKKRNECSMKEDPNGQ